MGVIHRFPTGKSDGRREREFGVAGRKEEQVSADRKR
jgi:hypothetical protein